MPTFHPLEVVSVDRIAQDAVCIDLKVPEELRDNFLFKAGQHLPLRHVVDGRKQFRSYSIVSGPSDKVLRLGVRLQPGGVVSTTIGKSLAVGAFLDVGFPTGRFVTAIDSARARSYVAFAAGSGITPILSLAKHILAHEPQSRFTLIYGNRSIAHTMFLEDTLSLKNRYINRFAVHFVMSREPQATDYLNGRIDGAKVRQLEQRIDAIRAAQEYFVCGPGAMVEEVREVLADINPGAPVLFERFGIPPAVSAATPAVAVAAETHELLATISVTVDGRVRTFPMAPDDFSVLDAAERAGLELPFSCRAGICATCRTRVTEGEAQMLHNIGLERWEIEAGFVLCCQTRPTTKTLAINYDQK